MKKIMNMVAIATILLAFAACEKDGSSLNSNKHESALKKAVTKNFKSSATGVIEYSYNPACGPTYTQSSISGSGTGTHIGNFETDATFCVDENGIASSEINGTITAANGDQIFYYMADPSVSIYFDGEGLMHLEYTITGGTGRFENATGNFELIGSIDFVNFTWDFTGDGYITY